MYLGLQAAAERTGRKITLAQCGWASQAPLQAAMEAGAAQFCPSVRSLFVDGRDPANRRRCWAAADIFVSLSDNVQETFGLTPVEAMAAGLPCVVSDWNGYKETVRDGVDGFRIATWAPPPGAGDALSRAREAETRIMDLACWAQAASTSVDLGQLADRLVTLVENEDLRKQMGAAGAARAKSVFDWPVVFAQHQALWGELDARRLAATGDELAALSGAPKVSAGGDDFFRTFGHYPTHALGPETQVKLASGASWERYKAISANPLFPMDPAPERNAQPLWRALEGGELSLAQACAAAGLPMRTVLLTVGTLAKMGLVELSQ